MMAIGNDDMGEEAGMQEKATAVCDKLGLSVTVRSANAVPILLAMCEALTEKVLKLEKDMISMKGNGDGRAIRTATD